MVRKLVSGLFVLSLMILIGCSGNSATLDKKTTSPGKAKEGKPDEVAKDGDNKHEGWWCAEHGIPEHDCAQCNAKVAAEYKKKGDWCKEHDRPESQCFICHPELKAKFAAQYRAKYGKEPPSLEEEKKPEGKKDEGKKEGGKK